MITATSPMVGPVPAYWKDRVACLAGTWWGRDCHSFGDLVDTSRLRSFKTQHIRENEAPKLFGACAWPAEYLL